MTDGNGLPLALVVAGANTHDIKLVADMLDALQTGRPDKRLRLCMDKGYEAKWLGSYLKSRRYEPHIQSQKDESEAIKNTDFKAHRWVVERTHSWMNRYRRVLTRWEKMLENYEAMLHFACGLIVWNKVLLRYTLIMGAKDRLDIYQKEFPYYGFDLFWLLPNKPEAFGLVYIEASMVGVPALGIKIYGIIE